jgi:hypothetical protein
MTQQNPITPPPELVQRWLEELYGGPVSVISPFDQRVLIAAAQWGADQELKACCEWMADETPTNYINALRAARRSKPPSLKEQVLEALAHILNNSSTQLGADTIRRALEALPDD